MIDVSSRIADRYRVDARIGGGGMADVYDGFDEVLTRPVAIKLLRGIDDPAAARRFAEEIRLTARVSHPNIVRLFDAGEHDGSPYLVLERVSGGTLAAEMIDGPMDPQRVALVGRQLAAALAHAHVEGIVHRDVKPSNVLLTSDGAVRLADFGIALTATATRLTVTGTIAGSAGYVAPEQVLGSGAGAASDVYALGLVLLECLTGGPPWSGTTVEVALARITADPPVPEHLGHPWVSLLTAMTARAPEDRPPMALVEQILGDVHDGRDSDVTLLRPPPRPDARIPALTALSVLLLLASAVMVLTSGGPQPAVAATTPRFNLAAAQADTAPAGEPVVSESTDERGTVETATQERTQTEIRQDRPRRSGGAGTAQGSAGGPAGNPPVGPAPPTETRTTATAGGGSNATAPSSSTTRQPSSSGDTSEPAEEQIAEDTTTSAGTTDSGGKDKNKNGKPDTPGPKVETPASARQATLPTKSRRRPPRR